MRSCREVVRLVGSDAPLSFREKLSVWLHYAICKSCVRYAKQLTTMERGFRGLFCAITSTDPDELKRLKADIKRKIVRPNCPSSDRRD
jgi:hypothetical protein